MEKMILEVKQENDVYIVVAVEDTDSLVMKLMTVIDKDPYESQYATLLKILDVCKGVNRNDLIAFPSCFFALFFTLYRSSRISSAKEAVPSIAKLNQKPSQNDRQRGLNRPGVRGRNP
jgi:hypothetical protein